jgi:hypothetical protein
VLAASVGIGANTTFVVSVQVLRVFIMVVAAPPLVRIVARWDNSRAAELGARCGRGVRRTGGC